MDPTSRQLLSELQRFRSAWRDACQREPELARSFTRLRTAADAFFHATEESSAEPASDAGSAPARQGPRGEERRGRSRSLEDFRAELHPTPARCTLKAEATELLLERKRRTQGADELDPAEGALYARAKELPDCSLWMLDRGPEPFEVLDLQLLAACYRNLAEAARRANADEDEAGRETPPSRRLMALMAEAQSALYAMLSRLGVRSDRDQLETFTWLRERTDYHRIYIPRHMDRNRLARPEDYEELSAKLAELDAESSEESEHQPQGGQVIRTRTKRSSKAS